MKIRNALFLLSIVELLGQVGDGALGGHLAEHHDVRHGVAADAVAAVDTAGDLTGCEQAGDGVALGVDDPGLGVDLHAAHGVVDAGGRS